MSASSPRVGSLLEELRTWRWAISLRVDAQVSTALEGLEVLAGAMGQQDSDPVGDVPDPVCGLATEVLIGHGPKALEHQKVLLLL